MNLDESRKMRWGRAVGFLFLILCSACGKEMPPVLSRPLPVTAAEVRVSNVPIYIETFGRTVPVVSIEIRPQVGGRIERSYIEEGQEVRQGDELYLIDPEPYQAAVDRARAVLAKDAATLSFVKKKLERYTELIKGDFVSKLTIEEYVKDVQVQENQKISDEAELALAEIRLGYCRLTSPIDGKVGLAKIDPGNLVKENDDKAIVRIVQLDPIEVEFAIAQTVFEGLQPFFNGALPLALWLPSHPEELYHGEVVAVDNAFYSGTGTVKVKGRFSNPGQKIWPGEFVYLRLLVREQKEALVAPFSAIQRGQKGAYVYVLKEDGRVDEVAVATAERIGDWIVIEKGLERGVRVVTDGQINLSHGVKVVVVEAVEPSA